MFRLREAGRGDNASLIALTKACPMQGNISLRIDRDPDFFALFQLRGPGKVMLVEQKGRALGCISLSMQNLFVEGNVRRALYLADLKVHPEFRRSRVAFLLMKAAKEFSQAQAAELAFLVTPEGNFPLLSLLKGRSIFPAFEEWARFKVCEFRPKKYRDGGSRPMRKEEAGEVYALWKETQAGFEMGKQSGERDFWEQERQKGTKVWVKEKEGRIVAAGSLFDTQAFKQNVVIGMPLGLRLGVGMQRMLSRVLPMTALPTMGQAIRMLNVGFWAESAEHSQEAMLLFRDFLAQAWREGYSFLSMAWDQNDSRLGSFQNYSHYKFSSVLMATRLSLEKDTERPQAAFTLDFSLV